jgi:glyoxylase-like metal-dependent hydrolase (beta-lactamase superfamily II)
MNDWRVGDVKITRVVEFEAPGLEPEMLLSGLRHVDVQGLGWLSPNYADADGRLTFSVHAYVVESEGLRIIVDTCVGNNKVRQLPHFNLQDQPFLDRLAEAGFRPDEIDIVLCTHLHVDHVGWNTRLVDDRWIPTFPNARYLFGRREWEHWQNGSDRLGDVTPEHAHAILDVDQVIDDSINPILEAGLHDLVESHHQVTREVSLFPTPGHTPGHVSVRIISGGSEAVITGDMIHHPVQIALPEIGSWTDYDREVAATTRKDFLARSSEQQILVLGTHFPTPSGGRVVRSPENGYMLVKP